MSFTFHVRPGTTDQRIVDSVYRDNVYRLPANIHGVDVMDFGANIGAFSILCAERGASRVFAFEPEPSNYQLLLRHIKESGYEGTIVPICKGVGEGVIEKLYFNESNYGANSANLSNNFGLREDKFVYMAMIDMYQIACMPTADIWKVDCEGGEVYLLKEVLDWTTHLPERMMVEFHGSKEDESIKKKLASFYNVETISDHEFIYTI